MSKDVDQTHESFGVVQVFRTSCHPPISLFDSKLRHGSVMSLKISRATRVKSSNTHDVLIMPDVNIVEIYLSESQFAKMVSSAGVGCGTSCTLSRIGSRPIEKCPADTTAKEYAKATLDSCQEVLTRMGRAQNTLEQISGKKSPLNKDEKKALRNLFDGVEMQIKSSIPFLIQSLQEAMEGVVEQAKSEIETHIMNAQNSQSSVGGPLKKSGRLIEMVQEFNSGGEKNNA